MISSRLRKLVLAAALAVMPLQGIAAAMMAAAPCHGGATAHAAHDGGHHGRAPDQPAHHDDAGSGVDQSHSCCHSTATASPAAMPPAALPDSPVRTLAADAPHDLFVPEQPQRPPLA